MTLAVAARQAAAFTGGLREVDGRRAGWFTVAGGPHVGALGPGETAAVERTIGLAVETGVPIVGVLATSGADVHAGIASLHGWGRVARALSHASGVVPIVLAVTGPCVSGPALLLGLADHVVFTAGAFAYVSGPDAVAAMTGREVTRADLGGPAVHAQRSGVATLVVESAADVDGAVADLLAYLPSHHLDDPPLSWSEDPTDRDTARAASAVPTASHASYDVREVVGDVLDAGSLLEVRPAYATNLVTAYGRVAGRAVGVIANQPRHRAGTLDIEASRKAARFVQHCDAFNVPLLTFVDTPGFEPGRDLEWRGMIRHGAEMVHAYAAATVPRVCVVLRKAYGGAYIVMDSRTLGNDVCVAWPGAEIAVLGADGAVAILHRTAGAAERARRAAEYQAEVVGPWIAAARGYVDDVIDPRDTRRAVAGALAALATKREHQPARKHGNTPL